MHLASTLELRERCPKPVSGCRRRLAQSDESQSV